MRLWQDTMKLTVLGGIVLWSALEVTSRAKVLDERLRVLTQVSEVDCLSSFFEEKETIEDLEKFT